MLTDGGGIAVQDTSFSAQSYLVARTAAGAVCKAVLTRTLERTRNVTIQTVAKRSGPSFTPFAKQTPQGNSFH